MTAFTKRADRRMPRRWSLVLQNHSRAASIAGSYPRPVAGRAVVR